MSECIDRFSHFFASVTPLGFADMPMISGEQFIKSELFDTVLSF